MRLEAPEELAHAAVLVIATPKGKPEVHLYLPELGKPRRIYSPDQRRGSLG
jgi:hypothetical protein